MKRISNKNFAKGCPVFRWAIIMASGVMLVSGLFASLAPKVYADTSVVTQSVDEQAKMAQMKTTIDTLRATIADLTVKVQAKQAMTQPKAMTLPEIAVEVQRITKEEEVLAQKVQVYVAAHPRTATMATAETTTASIAVSTVEASAKIAEIKKEITDLTDKLLAQKTAVNTVTANPTQTTNTAETAVPVQTPAQPSGTVKTDTTAPSQVTPEITITPEGDVAKNGQVQTVPVSQDSSKKGLFQSITDYFKSLFKF
ncbi:MAG: hypothetical protein NTX14_03765 [Candidatus Nealsonbacteria bacterium]|nr:hypothetical protein [Candidatus Nealsonbacteria bacterium]